MKILIYIILISGLLFTSCSDEEIPGSGTGSHKIELSLHIDNYIESVTKAVSAGTEEEQKINNLYLFLFPTSGSQTLLKYYISASTFTGGSWSSTDKKLLMNLTQAETGNRQVYVVANCTALKNNLDAVTTISGLESVLQTTNSPWSTSITTPLLMSGSKSHNFNLNYQLNDIILIRAVAKLQLNIKLSAEHQSIPVVESKTKYNYKYIDFDKNTYILKPSAKTDNLVSSADWVSWDGAGTVTSYTLDQGKVINLNLTTYLNERDNSGSAIEISLPYQGIGPLPPPEFGDETYKLILPAKIERNRWYIYDIEI